MEKESKKNDKIDNKLKYELFPIESPAIEEIVKVYMAGEKSMVAIRGKGLTTDIIAMMAHKLGTM